MSLSDMKKKTETFMHEQTEAFTFLTSFILKVINKINGGAINHKEGQLSSTESHVAENDVKS